MNIVSFWAPRPDHDFYRDQAPLLELQRRNCAKYRCRQIVISDVPPPIVTAPFEIFCVPDLPYDLMPAILRGQLAYLESAAFDDDTILVGVDCLLGADPHPVFAALARDRVDLAVTTHPFADCILNTGAIFCPRAARDKIIPFWRQACATVGPDWGDDQRALAAALGATLEHGVHARGDARVAFLPVPAHNMAPDGEFDPVASTVVHFRGRRKDWMARWAARFAAV